jgi:hypothetical protein
MADIIKYRLAVASDVQFIVRSWLDSYRSSHGAGILSSDPLEVPCACGAPIAYDYDAVMEVTLAKLLQRPGLSAWVAYNPCEKPPHDLYGYLVSEQGANVPSYANGILRVRASDEPLIHYVYIKDSCRGFKIARALFKVAGIDPSKPFIYTCRTPTIPKLEDAKKLDKRIHRWAPTSVRFDKKEQKP